MTTWTDVKTGARLQFSRVLVTETCAQCGMVFGIPQEFETLRRADKKDFYCPSGHSLVYRGETKEQVLQREVEALKEENKAAWDQALDAANKTRAEKRAHASTKGALTKVRKRASAGVCLHCNRTFQNVARHMTTQHAEAAR